MRIGRDMAMDSDPIWGIRFKWGSIVFRLSHHNFTYPFWSFSQIWGPRLQGEPSWTCASAIETGSRGRCWQHWCRSGIVAVEQEKGGRKGLSFGGRNLKPRQCNTKLLSDGNQHLTIARHIAHTPRVPSLGEF